MHLWIWHWQTGGYNSTKADTKEQALEIGNKMSTNLKIDEKTLHIGTYQELNKLDEQYASLFY